MVQLDQYVKILIEHKLTQQQFLLMYIIYKRRLDLLVAYKQAFPSDDGTMIGQYMVKDLIDRGFIEIRINIPHLKPYTEFTSNTSEQLSTAVITNKFLDLFIDRDEAITELLSIYPLYKTINISEFTLRDLYIDAIVELQDEHNEVIKDIKYAIANYLSFCPIDEFIKSKAWLIYRSKRLPLQESHLDSRSNFSKDDLENSFNSN